MALSGLLKKSIGSMSEFGNVPGLDENTTANHQVKSLTLSVHGQVESGQFTGVDEISCGYEFVIGPDWQLQAGHESGETQGARNQMISEERPSVVWNFPVECSFSTSNFHGWPRLALTVRDKERNLVGYGSLYIPTDSGKYVRYCKLFTPLASTHLGNSIAKLTSDLPEYYDSRFTTACQGREASRVVSLGVVKVTILTRVSGKEALGYC